MVVVLLRSDTQPTGVVYTFFTLTTITVYSYTVGHALITPKTSSFHCLVPFLRTINFVFSYKSATGETASLVQIILTFLMKSYVAQAGQRNVRSYNVYTLSWQYIEWSLHQLSSVNYFPGVGLNGNRTTVNSSCIRSLRFLFWKGWVEIG